MFSRPVIIFDNALGDFVLAAPTIRAISAFFGGRAELVCNSGVAKLFFGQEPLMINLLDDFYIDRSERRINGSRIAEQLMSSDLIIDLCHFPQREGAEEYLSLISDNGSRFTVGYGDFYDLSLLTEYKQGMHVFDLQFCAAKFLDRKFDIGDFSAPFKFQVAIYDQINALKSLFDKAGIFVTVQTRTKNEKTWEASNFASLINILLEEFPALVFVILGDDGPRLDIDESLGERVVYFGSNGNLFEASCAWVECSDYFIGLDSVFLHVADLCRVPSVAIFGPTSFRFWGCRFTRHEHVITPTRQINDISVAQVKDAFVNLLMSC